MISKMRKMPDLMDFFWFLCLCVCQFWYCALLEPRSRASPAPTRCLLSKQTPRTYFPILLLIKKNIYKKIFLFLSPNLTNAHMWPAMLAGQPNSGTLAALAAWWLIKQFQPFFLTPILSLFNVSSNFWKGRLEYRKRWGLLFWSLFWMINLTPSDCDFFIIIFFYSFKSTKNLIFFYPLQTGTP